MNDPTLWGILAVTAFAVLGAAAWLLLRDSTPRPPGRHERPKRTPQEPLHYDDGPEGWLSGDYQPPTDETSGGVRQMEKTASEIRVGDVIDYGTRHGRVVRTFDRGADVTITYAQGAGDQNWTVPKGELIDVE